MEKLTIKITLNPKNYVDAKLIKRLSGEENMAGALKTLAYERLIIEGLVIRTKQEDPAISAQTLTPDVESAVLASTMDQEEMERIQRREQLEREVDHKLNKLDNF